ncbi:uncharacterized protein IUM83_11512 [Phytophthora cinnamomi]|uniref:uncharacterized protein n=1 Tax=Phytophthora cinnamomi TaxID=4785 RepID=UPI003559DB3B|nr:hypothetical protein IUM83_11512 [Phytophthora cinnamomi]
MALVARTFRTVVGLPWSTLELLDRAMRWSAEPVMLEGPTSELWAEDLFAPCSSKCCLDCTNDDITDSSGSEMYDDEEDEDDDGDWSSSESEEELDGFSFAGDGDVDFWGDRWFWTLWRENDDLVAQSCSDLIDSNSVEASSYVAERLVDYVMPSMDPYADAAIDSWIEKYGSSRSQVLFVEVDEPRVIDSSPAFGLPRSSTGLFVAVL